MATGPRRLWKEQHFKVNISMEKNIEDILNGKQAINTLDNLMMKDGSIEMAN
jgi:hypothetical protein